MSKNNTLADTAVSLVSSTKDENFKFIKIRRSNMEKQRTSNQYDTICRPLCGQTQAFWSADKRNGGGAVENRTA